MLTHALVLALSVATSAANSHWRHVPNPCAGKTSIVVTTGKRLDAARSVEATMAGMPAMKALGAMADASAATEPIPCRIRLAADRIKDRPGLCMVLTHEGGHLRDLRFADNSLDPSHSLDPLNVMAAHGGRMTAECMEAFVPMFVRTRRQHGMVCVPLLIDRQWFCSKSGPRNTRRSTDESR